MDKKVSVPPWYRHGIRTLAPFHKEYPEFITADTETVNGRPLTLQLCYGAGVKVLDIRNNPTGLFLDAVQTLLPAGGEVWFHYFEYDHAVIFRDWLHLMYSALEVTFGIGTFQIWFTNSGNNPLVTIRRDKIVWHVRDTFRFFPMGLGELSKRFCPDLKKLPRPKKIGELDYLAAPTRQRRQFIRYAERDVQAGFAIVEKLRGFLPKV